MAATAQVSPATRPLGPRSCCPAGRTRSSTFRPRRAWRWSAGNGATPTRRSRRSLRRARLPGGSARPRDSPEPHLRHRASCRGGRLRRLRLDRARTDRHHAPARGWPGLLQLVPDRGHAARADRRHRGGRLDGRVRGRGRRLRRGVGERRAAARARRFRRAGGRGLQRAEPGGAHARRAAGRALHDRGVRHQRADLAPPPRTTSGCARRHSTCTRARVVVPTGSSAWLGGFEFTEGAGLERRRRAALLLPQHQLDLPAGSLELERVTLFRPKSGYTGVDIGRYLQPGSNGLTFDPAGRLVMRQHGNRRDPAGEPARRHDRDRRRLRGPAAQQPERPGLPLGRQRLWFTDPPFGRPGMADDPDRELDFSGVFRVSPDGDDRPDRRLAGGTQRIAFSPDERTLYVGNWDPDAKVVVRYELSADGDVLDRVDPVRHDRRARRGRDRRPQGRRGGQPLHLRARRDLGDLPGG